MRRLTSIRLPLLISSGGVRTPAVDESCHNPQLRSLDRWETENPTTASLPIGFRTAGLFRVRKSDLCLGVTKAAAEVALGATRRIGRRQEPVGFRRPAGRRYPARSRRYPPPQSGSSEELHARRLDGRQRDYRLLLGAVVIWLLTGFYTVRPDEVGINMIFGQYTGTPVRAFATTFLIRSDRWSSRTSPCNSGSKSAIAPRPASDAPAT